MSEIAILVEDVNLSFPKRRGLKDLILSIFKDNRVQHHALKGINLSVAKGEIVGIIGTNGCGKSTTGRSILRLVEPHRGNILYQGQDLTSLNPNELRPFRRQMQMIF